MTELQLKVFELVRDRLTEAGFSPTIGEVSRQLEISEHSARNLIEALVRMGKLKRRAGATRGLELTETPDLRSAGTGALRAELARRGVTMEAAVPRRLPANASRPCAARFCQERVGRGNLFCRNHWFRVPHWLRQSILEAFAARNEPLYAHYFNEARDHLDGTRPLTGTPPRKPLLRRAGART